MSSTTNGPNGSAPLDRPFRVDGGIVRIVEAEDGDRIESWGPDGWRLGGASFKELLSAPPPPVKTSKT